MDSHLFCRLGWSAVVQSWLTANSAFPVPTILLLQPPSIWKAKVGRSPKSGVRDQLGQHGEILSLLKIQKLAGRGGASLWSQLLRRLRQENRLNLGVAGCSEPRWGLWTPAWLQREIPVQKKKKKKEKKSYIHTANRFYIATVEYDGWRSTRLILITDHVESTAAIVTHLFYVRITFFHCLIFKIIPSI